MAIAAPTVQTVEAVAPPSIHFADPVSWGVAPQAVEVLAWRRREAKYFQLSLNEYVGIFEPNLHYEVEPGLWDETDLSLIPDGPDHIMDRAFFNVRVTRSDVEITNPQTGAGVRWLTRTRLTVADGKVQFSKDGLSWEYEIRPVGVKLSATVVAARGIHTYVFNYRLMGGISRDFTIDADGNAQGDGFVVRRAQIVGANRITYGAGAWRVGPGPRLSFDFDDSVLPPEAFPYVIDPSTNFDIAAGGDDGFVARSEANTNPWPPTTGGSVSDDVDNAMTDRTDSGNFHSINVTLYRWDTSSLADNAVLSEAKLAVWVTFKTDEDARNLTFDWYLFVGALAFEDWIVDAQTDAHTGIDLTGIGVGALSTFVMQNQDGVSKTGFTGLRSHVSGGDPPGKNQLQVRTFESVTIPRLTVTFTIPAVPVITGVSPTSGPIAGGQSVTITGTGLLNASSVTFGGTEVTSIDSNTDIQIVVTTAAHALGLVDVVVVNPGGTDTEVNAYTYVVLPVITGVSPVSGPIAGGTSVTITGTGLLNASSVKFGGTEVTSIDSNTDIQIVVTTAAHASGLVDVVVINPGGTDTEVGAYTFLELPVITSVDPVAGPIGGGVKVEITGTDLSGATAVTFGGTAVTSIDANTATRIEVTVAAHAAGLVDVVVTTPGGSDTEVGAYTFLDPAITDVSPNVGPSAGGQSVTITGTDLDDASSVTFGGVVALDTFDDVHNTLLTDHISDSGETWTAVSAGISVKINAVFPPDPPAARQSGSNLEHLYLWSAEGADGILKCHFFQTTGGGSAACGLFFRRNPSTPTEKWHLVLESSLGNPDSTLRLTSQGGGGVNETATIFGTLQGDCRIEFSGPEIKVYFDNVLKISVNSAHSQNEVGLGLLRSTFGGGGAFEEWDNLSFVDAGVITSNTAVQIVVTTPPGPVGLVDVVVTNPGGETTVTDGYTYLGGGGTAGLLQLQKELLL